MDPTLHQKQGINHLRRVLDYAPFVATDGRATVHLTQEDWWVVADTLFRLNTPPELLPPAIRDFRLTNGDRTIEVDTEGTVIEIDVI
jgi:hypothetical protein